MGWNFAYDVIRQWVFDNHVAEFNQALATYQHKGKARYSPIQVYEDIFKGDPGEHTVIDTFVLPPLVTNRPVTIQDPRSILDPCPDWRNIRRTMQPPLPHATPAHSPRLAAKNVVNYTYLSR
jgi:hypothetical protein